MALPARSLRLDPVAALAPAGSSVARTRAQDLAALTGLRFLAAAAIVVHHYKLFFPWELAERAPSTLSQGVSFFFVLSGFILTHAHAGASVGYLDFARSRFARLWPLHAFATLALWACVPPHSVTFEGEGPFGRWPTLAANLAMLHAIVPFEAYVYSWNAVSWSISTEWFFYLAFPLLLVDVRRRWGRRLVGAAALAALVAAAGGLARLPPQGGPQDLTLLSLMYANPMVRGVEFVMGMATWVLWDRHLRARSMSAHAWTAVEVALVLALLAWFGSGFGRIAALWTSAPAAIAFGHAGSSWAFAAAIAVLASSRGALARALSGAVPVFLGRASFAIYLLHPVLFKFLSAWLPRDAVSPAPVLAVLLLLAAVAHLAIEQPGQRLLSPRRRRPPAGPHGKPGRMRA